MMPWGHFAVAFLPYTAYTLGTERRLPSRRATLALLVGTQFPDLVDKPLAWSFDVLPSGRMLAHSVVVAVPLVVLLAMVAYRSGHIGAAALFIFGYLSHIYTDSMALVHHGADYYFLPNLFWPLVPPNPDRVSAFLPHLTRVAPERYALAAAGLVLLAALYGYPILRSWNRSRTRTRPRQRS